LTLAAPGPANPTLRIQFTEKNGLAVNRIHLTHGPAGDKFKVDLAAIVERAGSGVKGTYEGRYQGKEWTGSLNFTSLIPSDLPDEADRIGQAVRTALTPLGRLQWLDANRLAGGNEIRPTRCCLPDGSDLPSLLRDEPGPAVLGGASRWLATQSGLGEELSLRSDASGRQQLVHRSGSREALPLHLAGEGIRALLPILLCAVWAETHAPGAPTMLAVEEPEAHLHPTTQVALFDRLAQTVQLGIPVVLETHSVYLLRAMQLAVLDGSLKPEQIGLYWVEQEPDGASTITHIEIDPDATLTGWRPDLFEKEQEMAHRILDLRWKAREAP